MVLYCLLDEINGPTASLENARDFLFQENLLKSSMSCPGCNAAMTLVPCSSSKSPDVLIWRCSQVQEHQSRQRPLWTEDRTEDLHSTPVLPEHKGTHWYNDLPDDWTIKEHGV